MLDSIPVTTLKRVGAHTGKLLANLNIYTVHDLLFHFPLRYQDRTRITNISDIHQADEVLIEGKIQGAQVVYTHRRQLICQINDGTGSLILHFYHFNARQKEQLMRADLRVRCFGEVRKNYKGRWEMVHPQYCVVGSSSSLIIEENLTPIYPTTRGMSQPKWRYLMEQALTYVEKPNFIEDLLPEPLRDFSRLPTLSEALMYVHRPPKDAPLDLLQAGKHPAQQRLIFEELLYERVALQQLRVNIKMNRAPILKLGAWQEKLKSSLPFQLTTAQQRVIDEINQDLSFENPMLRLLQGDVGSGKTIVAAIAVIKAVENNYQAAIMAPTELLAEQHYRALKQWFEPFGISVGWLVGNLNAAERRETLRKIREGGCQVIVGTQALFQKAIVFYRLGLIVVDEQHRFGVRQRFALKEKGSVEAGSSPHQLIMTATPIPRTLAMTVYADLDISVIDELPSGRQSITTLVLSNVRRHELMERIKENCQAGKQAYWVCTLIEDSEVLQCETAEATYKNLKKLLPTLNIGLIHGRLHKNERNAVMTDFRLAKINVLVATTVIEVGVDVPNANLMVIENAERLGLVQIHQLRGRIGRGKDKSYCVLLYQKPLSDKAWNRLALLRDLQDGFAIAQKDLELRGAGELLGVLQAGMPRFRIANVIRDYYLFPLIKKIADFIIRDYSSLSKDVLNRWLQKQEKIYLDV